ncbi:hypothetical protein GCM10010399_36200 [Dactylosporangium fulvum]|uniref:GAP family protein n=1 Tax=Dactylosporangium fulvum TaxID=53359 RepID=A0ABY5W643_9ACTN|nr:GAP family protein [Dactylosporangium fulvum]UWP85032.1 GAP family protein [Dactylosporangium fulvum]
MGLGAAIGAVLPPAVGVALSPLPVVAVTRILATENALRTGLALAGGWVGGLAVATAAVVAVADSAGAGMSRNSAAIGALFLAFGIFLLLLAASEWRRRPRPGRQPKLPDWTAAVETMQPVTAAGIGVMLSAANPKNLCLLLAAAMSIARQNPGPGQTVVAVALFVVIGSLTVAGPVVALLTRRDGAVRAWLSSLHDWFLRDHGTITFMTLLLLGTVLLGNGIATITA